MEGQARPNRGDPAPTGYMKIESTSRNTRCASRDAGAMPLFPVSVWGPLVLANGAGSC